MTSRPDCSAYPLRIKGKSVVDLIIRLFTSQWSDPETTEWVGVRSCLRGGAQTCRDVAPQRRVKRRMKNHSACILSQPLKKKKEREGETKASNTDTDAASSRALGLLYYC